MKMITRILPVLSLAALCLTGCVTRPGCMAPHPHKIKIDTIGTTEVHARLVDAMTNAEFKATGDADNHLSFAKPVNGTSGLFDRVAVDSATPQVSELNFDLYPGKCEVTVVANADLFTGETNRDNMNKKWSPDIEHLLQNLKAGVENTTYADQLQKIYLANQGRIGIGYDGAGYIVEVIYNSPAARAGLQPGDRIVRVNGHAVGDNIVKKVGQVTGPVGSKVTLTVIRNGQKVSISAVREAL